MNNSKVLYKVGDALEYIDQNGNPFNITMWEPPLIIYDISNSNGEPLYRVKSKGIGDSGGFYNHMVRLYIPYINEQKLRKKLGLND